MNVEDIRERLGLSRVEFCHEVGSTQDAARTLSASPPYLVYARRQCKGRGRMGRSWLSEEGGLYFTLVLEPGPHNLYLPLISAGLILDKLSSQVPGLNLKWPNDIYHKKGKLAGVLAEVWQHRLYLGVGINVNQDWTETAVAMPATSLFMLTGRMFNLDGLMRDMLGLLMQGAKNLSAEGFGYFHPRIREQLISSPQPVRFVDEGREITAKLIDIDAEGNALVENEQGKRVTISLPHMMGER